MKLDRPIRRGVATLFAGALVLATTSLAAAQEQQGPPPDDRGGGPRPVEVVAHVLDLSEAQMNAWKTILDSSKAQAQPIADQIRSKEQALRDAMQSATPDAATVGQLVIDLKGLREQLRAVGDSAADAFVALLDDEQDATLADVEAAAALCPAVPAFLALHLIDPPQGPPPSVPPPPSAGIR